MNPMDPEERTEDGYLKYHDVMCDCADCEEVDKMHDKMLRDSRREAIYMIIFGLGFSLLLTYALIAITAGS